MKKINAFSNSKMRIGDMILFAVLIASVLVLFGMSMLSYSSTYDKTISYAEDSITQRTEQSAKEIEATFEERFAILEYIATLPEIKNMKWSEQYAYIKGKESDLGFEHLFIIGADGFGYYVQDNMIRNQSEEEFFTNCMENDRYITEPFTEYVNDKAITTICVSIHNDMGKKVGSLCGAMDLQNIYSQVESMQTDTCIAFIVNSQGEYVASADMTQVHRGLNVKTVYSNAEKHDINFILNNLNNNTTTAGEVMIDNIDYYASVAPIDNCDWQLVLTVEKREAIGDIENMYIIQFVSAAILIVILIVTIRFIAQLNSKDKAAFVDSLTGINNRARCTIMMDKLETHRKESIMIVNFDLNDFKEINDKRGHNCGDEALVNFSKVLSKTFGKVGFIGRMGGDEFIAILLGKTQEEYEKLLKDMKDLIATLNSDRNQQYVLSPSYGNAIRNIDNPEEKSIHELYEEADRNMYFYKETYKSVRNSAN